MQQFAERHRLAHEQPKLLIANMNFRTMLDLVTASRVAESDTKSGLIAPTFTTTTDGSGTVKTYSCGQ